MTLNQKYRMHRALAMSLALVASTLIITPAARAQTAPNAGTLERQIRQDQQLYTPPTNGTLTAPKRTASTGETVLVHAFALRGVTLVNVTKLEKKLARFVGQSLTLGELEEAVDVVTRYYRSQGYFVRAYLPSQDVTEGVIIIQVVEARLGDVKLEGSATRADVKNVRDIILGELKTGEHYSADRLERGLLLANDLPGISASGVLAPGSEVGHSDLRLKVEDRALFSGDVNLNNFGARATGANQINTGVNVNNLSGYGDQVSLRALGSQDLGYVQAGYQLPIGTDGLRAGASASYLSYELGRQFKALDVDGTAMTMGVNVSYPFIRSDRANLFGSLNLDRRRYVDNALGAPLNRRTLNVASARFDGNHYDDWGGGGLLRYNVQAVGGDLDITDPASRAADRIGAQTDGAYAKLFWQVGRDQYITDRWVLRADLSGQFASNNLDSSEKFALGGPFGVRAYPINEALGDDGILLNVEMHHYLDAWDLYGFGDIGAIRQQSNTWAGWNAGTGTPNKYWLAALGVGANYTFSTDTRVESIAAIPVGSNQGSTINDRNQDGSHKGPRVWVGLSQPF